MAQFTAERGEVNKMRVRVSGSGTTVLFIDLGGLPIDPGSGCEPFRGKVNEAICSLPTRFTVAQALLGDRNDFADLDSLGRTQVNAAGENGDDNMIVGRRATRWSIGGGNGDDRLTAKGDSALSSSLRGGVRQRQADRVEGAGPPDRRRRRRHAQGPRRQGPLLVRLRARPCPGARLRGRVGGQLLRGQEPALA